MKFQFAVLKCFTFHSAIILLTNAQSEDVLPCDLDTTEEFIYPPQFGENKWKAELELTNFQSIDARSVYVQVNYDGEKNRASVASTIDGDTSTIVIDYKTGHSIQFSKKRAECQTNTIETGTAFIDEMSVLFPTLEIDPKSRQLFSTQNMLGFDLTQFKGFLGNTKIRNEIPCSSWAYCYSVTNKSVKHNIISYWLDMNWDTSGSLQPSFLGYDIITKDYSDNSTSGKGSVSVVYMDADIDPLAFEIPEGLQCTANTTKPFPFSLPHNGVWQFQTEVLLAERRIIIQTQSWFHFTNKFRKITYTFPGEKTVTNTADPSEGITYVQKQGDGSIECTIEKSQSGIFGTLGTEELLLLHLGNAELIFGDTAGWIYIGNRVVRNFKTGVWQKLRTDWPFPAMGNTFSLWDWHLANISEIVGEAIPIAADVLVPIHLKIHILETTIPSFFQGLVEYEMEGFLYTPAYSSDANVFDVSECYSELDGLKERLRFQVEARAGSKKIDYLENSLLSRYAVIIAASAEVNILRVAQIKTVTLNEKMYIEFFLLGIHPNISQVINTNNEMNLQRAKKNLGDIINGGLSVPSDDGSTELLAVPFSLSRATPTCL